MDVNALKEWLVNRIYIVWIDYIVMKGRTSLELLEGLLTALWQRIETGHCLRRRVSAPFPWSPSGA